MSAQLGLLDLMGKSYLIELCVDIYNRRQREEAFQYFISEVIRSMNNSIAKAFGGAEYTKSWKQILEYKPDNRTADEIIDHVLGKLKALED